MNHSGISGQETMALFRNAIGMNIDTQVRLRLGPALTRKCRTTLKLDLLFETQKKFSSIA